MDCVKPKTYWLLSYVVRILVTGDEAEGRFSAAEYLKPPGDMTPLHVHHAESQTTYVLEGEATIYLPDGPQVLGPGDCLYQPRGVPHTEKITSDVAARVLDIYAPAGFERFIESAGRETEGLHLPPAAESPDEARTTELTALAQELGIELLGPPGALPTEGDT